MVDTRSIPRRPIDAASEASPSDREIHAVAATDGVSSGFAVCATMLSTVRSARVGRSLVRQRRGSRLRAVACSSWRRL